MTSYDRLHHSSVECERDLICSPDPENPGPSLALPRPFPVRSDSVLVELRTVVSLNSPIDLPRLSGALASASCGKAFYSLLMFYQRRLDLDATSIRG